MKIKHPLFFKTLVSTLVLSALFLPLSANADHRDRRHAHYDNHYADRYADRYVKAKVVDVAPVFDHARRYEEPVRTCYSERGRYDAGDRRRNALIGGVVGGVIGYQVGDKSRHKRIGAVAGAILGATVAKNATSERATHCETHYETRYDDRRQVVGYDVVYKYRGRHYTTFTDYRPGRWIEVERPRRFGR